MSDMCPPSHSENAPRESGVSGYRPVAMALRWQASKQRFFHGDIAVCGRVPVGSVSYDGVSSRDEPLRYTWRLNLPGKERAGRAADTLDAKAALEAAFAEWLIAASLRVRDGSPEGQDPKGLGLQDNSPPDAPTP